MKLNVGGVDRLIRAILGASLTYWVIKSSPVLGSLVITTIISLFAGANMLSALFSWCPVYSIFQLSTRK